MLCCNCRVVCLLTVWCSGMGGWVVSCQSLSDVHVALFTSLALFTKYYLYMRMLCARQLHTILGSWPFQRNFLSLVPERSWLPLCLHSRCYTSQILFIYDLIHHKCFNLRLRNLKAALLQNHLPFSPWLAFLLFFDQSTEGYSLITVLLRPL